MKISIIGFTSALTLIALGCAEAPKEEIASQDEAIVGGTMVPAGALPWMVGVYERDDDSTEDPASPSGCGGTLIDAPNGIVVTAAHCVAAERSSCNGHPCEEGEEPTGFAYLALPPQLLKVTIGNEDRSTITAEDYLEVTEVIVHGAYSELTLQNDIALLRVGGVDPTTPTPRVIGTRWYDAMLLLPGRYATVAGWGARADEGDSSDTLQWVRVPLVHRAVCDALLHDPTIPEVHVTDSMVCAGRFEGGRDACSGDSGGPMTVRDLDGKHVLAGIVSWGDGCAAPLSPGVYTNVLHAHAWMTACLATTPNVPCERLPELTEDAY